MNNVELLSFKIEKLESVFLNILCQKPEDRVISPNSTLLDDLRVAINEIFDDNTCVNVLYTQNTDKPFFGIRISPNMSPSDATIILASDERIKLNKYQIEFDSKLFDLGLSGKEIAATTVYEISAMMDDSNLFDRIRALLDNKLLEDDEVFNIRESINSAQLIIFALKDTMYKLSSISFVEDKDVFLSNPSVEALGLGEDLLNAYQKINDSINALGDSFREPGPSVLLWMLELYRDMKLNSRVIYDVLTDAKAFTASKLELIEIEKSLQAIDRIDKEVKVYNFDGKENKGKIPIVKSKINALKEETEIYDSLLESEYRNHELLNEKEKRRDVLNKEKEELKAKITKQSEMDQKRGEYNSVLKLYEEEKKELDELDDFFVNGIPESEEFKEYYDIKEITLFDMFPNTHHVESVCLLEKKIV